MKQTQIFWKERKEKGVLGPLLLWMVYLVGKYLLLFSETELPELYSLLVCKVLQAMRFKF